MNSLRAVLLGVVALVLAGCQAGQSVSVRQLIAHQALIDFSGLAQPRTFDSLEVVASLPQSWHALRPIDKGIYVHQQWQSPSHSTGIGVVHVHLPWPMTARTIVWFAKMEYDKQGSRRGKPQGRILAEWTDAMGREWFEAQNEKYHMTGYAMTSGFDAWIVYSGYRLADPLNPAEIGIAARSVDGILPTPMMNAKQRTAATAH